MARFSGQKPERHRRETDGGASGSHCL